MTPLFLLLLWPALSMGQAVYGLQPIDRTMEQIVRKQTLHINFLPCYIDSLNIDTSVIDNICLTYFPLDECYGLTLVYASWIFCNGTNTIITNLVKYNSTGILYYTSPSGSSEHIIFYAKGDEDYVYNFDGVYGYAFGTTSRWRQYPNNYLSVLNNFGLGNQQYRALPMNLPPQCVTSMRCNDNIQGCQTNNPQTRECQNNNCPSNNYPSSSYPSNNYPNNNYPSNNYPNSNYPSNNCPSSSYPSNNIPTNNYPSNNNPTTICHCPLENYPTDGYPSDSYPPDGYPSYDYPYDDYPYDDYPCDDYPSNSYPSDNYPFEGYPSNDYPYDDYPYDDYPYDDYPCDDYPSNSYPSDDYPFEGYPSNDYPYDDYPSNDYPTNECPTNNNPTNPINNCPTYSYQISSFPPYDPLNEDCCCPICQCNPCSCQS